MNFAEQSPSRQWSALKYRGEKFAEVWFKPEADPFVLVFRIPQKTFLLPGMAQQLTIDNLFKAVSMPTEGIESWQHGDIARSGGANPELKNPLPPPAPDVAYLEIHVRLKPPTPAVAEGSAAELSLKEWQDLEARWKGILALEASMDTVRILMEGLQVEMEGTLTKTLTIEEKTHALRADVAQWTKAKNRVRFALPKMKEFIHRAVWALGSPERKKLEELYKNHIEPHIPFPEMDKLLQQLESLQKDRQILSGQGMNISQESRSLSADVQSAFRTLQSNAAANSRHKKGASGAGKGKFFKAIRKASGADG